MSSARLEATRRLGALLQGKPGQLWVDDDWQMDVMNEAGFILFVINIVALQTSAVPGSPLENDR